MKITKDRIHSWEQVNERDYEKKFDDELIILLNPDETSREMGDYILECQEKAKDYDKMNKIIYDLTQSKIKLKEKAEKYDLLKKENKKLSEKVQEEGVFGVIQTEKNMELEEKLNKEWENQKISRLEAEGKVRELQEKLDSIQEDLIEFYVGGLDSDNRLTPKGGEFIRKYVNLVTGDDNGYGSVQ